MKSKKVFIGILVLFLLVPLITSSTIGDTVVRIKVYNNTVEFVNDDYSGNNKEYTFTVSNDSVAYEEWEFTILFIKNVSVDSDIVEKYTTCLSEKSSCEVQKNAFDNAWDDCREDLQKYESGNSTACSSELNKCELDLSKKTTELESKEKEISDIEKDSSGKQNQRWFFGGIGLVIGILFGKGIISLNKKGPKDESGMFNKNQAS